MPSTGEIKLGSESARVQDVTEFVGVLAVAEVAGNDAEFFREYHLPQDGRVPRRLCEHKNCSFDAEGCLTVGDLDSIPESHGRGMWVSTQGGNGSGYLVFDLGSTCGIGAINIWNGCEKEQWVSTRNVGSFMLEVSEDGSEYESIVSSVTLPPCDRTAQAGSYYGVHFHASGDAVYNESYSRAGSIAVDWLPLRARFVRFSAMKSVQCLGGGGGNMLSLSCVHFLREKMKTVVTLGCSMELGQPSETPVRFSCTTLSGNVVASVSMGFNDTVAELHQTIAGEMRLDLQEAHLELVHPNGTLLKRASSSGLGATVGEILGAELLAQLLARKLAFVDEAGSMTMSATSASGFLTLK